ncbi:MAG: DUF4118 domain-containing protein [Erysipelotrichaceae bacterium]|nr:DUF4118 domain-containing protein [Erysipelotrichaceae bacterium]
MKEKHILVCISNASDHQKAICAGAQIAYALNARFSAVVADNNYLRENADMKRNIAFAESKGARIITFDEQDFVLQSAEYARISNATHVVLQEDVFWLSFFSMTKRLSVQLSKVLPDIDIMMISSQKRTQSLRFVQNAPKEIFSAADILKMITVLLICTIIGYLFLLLGLADVHVIVVYLIGVLVIAMVTSGRIYSLVSSVLSVLIFNFFFTSPYFTLLSDPKNIATFAVMFLAALLQSSLTVRIKSQAVESSQKAYYTEVLLESSRVLSQAEGTSSVLEACAGQLKILLEKDVLMAEVNENNEVEPSMYFPFEKYEMEASLDQEAAECAVERKQICGNTTAWCSNSRLMVWPIVGTEKVLALCGIDLKNNPLQSFEKNLMSSILEQCAMVLETQRTLKLKQEIEEAARQEALRANLLRMISHDLRTPLTSISGNALLLMNVQEKLTTDKITELSHSIYEDSQWLIQLVENLLSITRIENGSMNIHFESELVEEVIEEALNHVDSGIASHPLHVELENDFIMAEMDASLIVQVLINLINNAVKHTSSNTEIEIRSFQRKNEVVIQVCDNGPGIPKDKQKNLFEMFTTLNNISGDSRRGMGLGLALCRSIIHAHQGTISMVDNHPHGSVFEFTLKASEVQEYE